MSKLKTPQDKKRASLKSDRRNAYGENAKSSRKNIPRSKQMSHQATRKAVNQELVALTKTTDEDDAANAELNLRAKLLEKERKAFRKGPDASLSAVIHRKRTGVYPNRF